MVDDARGPDNGTPAPSPQPGTDPVAPAAPAAATAEKPPVLCRDKARRLVHKYAAFGTAWAVLPIPVATSAGLTALETHLIYWVGRVYDDAPSQPETMMIAAGLELASVGLKTLAIEAANLIPVVGWGIKGAIAGSAIEGIGALVIKHFEAKHPGKEAAG